MHTIIQNVFIRKVSLRFYAKSKFCVCFEVHIPVSSPVVFRVNANVDLIVSALKLFKTLGIEPGVKAQDHEVISSLDELEECFEFYFIKCAAAERIVMSNEVFDRIVAAATSIDQKKVF